MSSKVALKASQREVDILSQAPEEGDLMGLALKIYWPDVGLAIHRAIEARHLLLEKLKMPILDLGCSDGKFTRLWTPFLTSSPFVLGCDLDIEELRHGAPEGRAVCSVAGDGRSLPLSEDCIATVIANSVLTHVPNVDRLLEEVARVLMPDGKLMASVPGPTFEEQLATVRILRLLGFPWLARRSGDRYNFKWQQWHRDGEAVWRKRFAVHGLSLVSSQPYPDKRTGMIWSLAFGLMRIGRGRFTILSALYKLRLLSSGWAAPNWLARALLPILPEDETTGGSLFLVARKGDALKQSDDPRHTTAPRVPPSTPLPEMDALIGWLTRSRVVIRDEAQVMSGGYGNYIDSRTWCSPMLYCEITGYAVQFWLRQQCGEALSRAVKAGDCLLRVQVSAEDGGQLAGAFPYGLSRPDGRVIPTFFSFDAAICASALTDLALRTGVSRFSEAAERAGVFMLLMQNEDGSFAAMRSSQPDNPDLPELEEWFADSCALHGKNAIALLKLWLLTGQRKWKDAAIRNLDWVRSIQLTQGGFPYRKGAAHSMTHTHCYATEGLLYAGLVLDSDRYLTTGIRGAEWLRAIQVKCGALYRDYRTNRPGLPKAVRRSLLHIGPVAQAVRIWWVADQISPGRPWTEAASRALKFLASIQEPSKNALVGGAFPQAAKKFGPWLRKSGFYSSWEAMFTYEAARLWTTGTDESAWSIF